jgi:hypothetical protein
MGGGPEIAPTKASNQGFSGRCLLSTDHSQVSDKFLQVLLLLGKRIAFSRRIFKGTSPMRSLRPGLARPLRKKSHVGFVVFNPYELRFLFLLDIYFSAVPGLLEFKVTSL